MTGQFSIEEIENFSYYDFFGYIGVPFFHIGGLKSTERLAELCEIKKDKKVLVVGSGTGYSACYLAKEFDCSVIGVDISEQMIMKARERAKNEKLADKVEFIVGDAYGLPFEDNFFDVVITEFVSIFLDKNRAFKEFVRVVKPGGFVGINELYKSGEIPKKSTLKIEEAEKIFSKVIGLPFEIPSLSEWKSWFDGALLTDVWLEEHKVSINIGEWIRAMGGLKRFLLDLLSILLKMIKYACFSKRIFKRLMLIHKAKNILLRNKSTAGYVGYILSAGKKL